MKNLKKTVMTAVALALATAGGVSSAYAQSAYTPPTVPPETPPRYTPPTVPPEGPGNTTVNNNNTNNNSNTNTNNNSATGGNGGNVSGSGNSSNSYNSEFTSYAGGPALAAAVDSCLTVGSTSIGIGAAGVSLTGGTTRSNYNQQCANDQLQIALLNFMNLNKDQPEIQAIAIATIKGINPQFGAAVDAVIVSYGEAMKNCGQRVGSPLDILSGGKTCTRPFSAAADAATRSSTTEVTVNVELKGVAPAAAAAAKPRATTARRASGKATGARTVAPKADGTCPTGTVTVCQVPAPRR